MSEQTPITEDRVAGAQPDSKSFWRKPVVIGVAAGLATVLVVGGVAAVVGAQMSRDDDTPAAAETTSLNPSTATAPVTTQPSASAAPAPGPLAPSDADSLRAAIIAAVAAAGGVGATEIDVEASGYDVEVQRADGTEAEVFVTVDGATTVRDEDDDDDDPLINIDQLDDLVRIALEAAGGGIIEKISTDDDDDEFYEVQVRLSDGSEVEVDLDPNLAVIEVVRD